MNQQRPYASGTMLVTVGTKRGLFILSSRDRERWEISTPALKGHRIFYATLDQRSGCRLFAADNNDFFGSSCATATTSGKPGKNQKKVFSSRRKAVTSCKISG
jgi:hypothetical protein